MRYNKNELEDILSLAMRHGGDFAEVFVEEKVLNSIGTEEKRVEQVNAGQGGGVGVRLIVSDKTYYAYTSDYELDSVKACALTVSKASLEGSLVTKFNLDKEESFSQKKDLILPDEVEVGEKIALVKLADEHCWQKDPRIVQVKVIYGDVTQKVVIANTDGDYVKDQRIRVKFIVQVVARDSQGRIQSGYDAIGAAAGYEFMQDSDVVAVADTAANRALMLLEAVPAPAGKMTVVMSSEAGGTMVHEACGHGLEADLVEKGLSVYAGKIGQLVANERVSVIDDGTMCGRYGTTTFDDEGTRCQKNVLIDHGVLKAYMTDRLTAKKMKIPLTGNGRRESYRHKPVTRMTNTYIAPGKDDPEEMIREVKRGFFAKKMGGGQVNTATGDFVFEVSEGYLIENGKITKPVKGATLTGNGPLVLRMIDRVGSDLGYSIGTCGKDGQGVPVADAQPTIRIPELIVGGLAE